jgi:endoglucanase Acf2
MQSSFPPFKPTNNTYCAPLPNIQLGTTVYPTNSWFENSIYNTVNDQNRYGQAIPWYWAPSYDNFTLNLAHNDANPLVITTTNGNLIIQESPGYDITVGTSNPTALTMTNIDDFTAQFVQISSTGTVNAYPMRGSPFASFSFESTPVNIIFNNFPNIVNVVQNSGNSVANYCYVIDTASTVSTVVNTSLVSNTTGGYQVNKLSFYDGLNDTGMTINAIYNGTSTIDLTINLTASLAVSLTVTLGQTTVVLTTPQPTNISNIAIQYASPTGPIVTLQSTSNQTFIVQLNLAPTIAPYITAIYVYPVSYRWFVFTSANLTFVSNQNHITSAANYTGILQIAFGGIDTTYYPALQSLYTLNAGGYATRGLTGNFSNTNNTWSFNIDWTLTQPNVLWLLPNHWNLMTMTGVNNCTASNYPLIQHFTYGNLTWYLITSSTVQVTVINATIPLTPSITTLTASQIQMLTNQLTIDIPFLISFLPGYNDPTASTDPYGFGTSAAAMGRMLVLAQLVGLSNADTISATAALKATLVAYMNGTNSLTLSGNINAFQLQYDSTWGGVLVPADYMIINSGGTVGAFGNSFYNDHHFHWGYLLYALYTLELLHTGISTTYANQIIALIKDISNPVTDNFSWKTRHKDWYTGHSWATGVDGEVNRQQESSGEAINGYYASYLMSNILANSLVSDAAGILMWTELLASQQYYANAAPGSQVGIFNQTGNIGMIMSQGKAFTLDWGMQPDSYNGRAIGMYGIQTMPYTEITFNLLSQHWVNSLPNLYPSYALTPTLIKGLLASTYNTILTPNEPISTSPFSVETDGVYWGLVALKILGFSTEAMSDADIQTAYTSAIAKQLLYTSPLVKQFDSFSNTLYWLFKSGRNITV